MTSSSPCSSPPTSSSPGDTNRDASSAPDPESADGPLSIDLRGEVCPFTFVRTKLALEELPIGAVLRVIVDHEPASRNLPRSAAEWGQEVLGVTPLGPPGPPGPLGNGSAALTWAIDLRKRVR
jgi:TusA-related sulfurtransferase